MRILLVEDDKMLGDAVRTATARAGHAVDWVQTLTDADAALQGVDYGLVLLDLQLPDGSGLAFLKSLRAAKDARPVLILTAQGEVSQRIEGLNAGADDYLVKPFDLGELAARIEAVARRNGAQSPRLQLGPLEADLSALQLLKNGREITLTQREWALFKALAARPGSILSKSRLEEALYEFGAEVESNAIEVYVSRLRKKLGDGVIATVRGLGYKLEAAT